MNSASMIIVWLILCVVIALLAKDRRPGPIAIFFISLVFSPIIGFIVAMFAKKKTIQYSGSSDESPEQ